MAKIDVETVNELAQILRNSDLTEISVQQGDTRIRLGRKIVHNAPAAPVASHVPPPELSQPTPPESNGARKEDLAGTPVKSPMVGTAYLSSDPTSPPFVSEGDTVRKGQTLLLVEAMKTFNAVDSPKDGVVKAILVDNGQPVEYNEPLIVIG